MNRGGLSVIVLLALVIAPLVPLERGQDPATPAEVTMPSSDTVSPPLPDITRALGSITPSFLENLGQVANPDVRFYAQGAPLSVGLTRTGVVYTLVERTEDVRTGPVPTMGPPSIETPAIKSISFTMTFDGCNAVLPQGRRVLEQSTNYFIGNDPNRWVRGARSFEEVVYENVYPGIDARFYFKDGMFKYEFHVNAGADPGRISIAYRGIEGTEVDSATGELLITTPLGIIRDARPVILDGDSSVLMELGCGFKVLRDGRVSFDLPDGWSSDRLLVIDPGLEYCSYLGGSNITYPRALAIDKDGTVVICGSTNSPDFPVPPDSNITPPKEGDNRTIFIVRLSADLISVLNTTFMGGKGWGDASDVIYQPNGDVCFTGATSSKDFPLLNPLFTWTGPDILYESKSVLVKLDSHLIPIVSTLLCGSSASYDTGRSITADSDGNVVITGWTNGTDFPVTSGAYCTTLPDMGEFTFAGYVSKFDSSVSALLYCTFLESLPWDMVIDEQGDAYITGDNLPGFKGTPGAFCETKSDNTIHCSILELDPIGSTLLAATLLGGSLPDEAYCIELATNGSVLVGGTTSSPDFPASSRAYNGGPQDAFLCMLDKNLTKLQYSTLLGGNNHDIVGTIEWAVKDELIYVGGGTDSTDLPITLNAFDGIMRGDADIFFMGINLTSNSIVYCSYFGGSYSEELSSNGLKINNEQKFVFVFNSWTTYSQDIPMTQDAQHKTGIWGMVAILDPTPSSSPGVLETPQNFQAMAGEGRVDLMWDPSTCMTLRNIWHRIYRGTSIGEGNALVELSCGKNQYTDYNVTNGTWYYYRVKAFTYADESPFSDEVTARPLGTPTAPRNLHARTGDGIITLTWDYPLGDGGGLTGYHIYRKEPISGASSTLPCGNTTTYPDTDVVVGTRYMYYMRAYNDWGESDPSNTVMLAALDVPGVVTNFKHADGDGRVDLTWGLPSFFGGVQVLKGYYLVKKDSGGGILKNWTPEIFNVSFTDLEVVNGQTYTYELAAFSDVGTGKWLSEPAAPYGRPSPPRLVAPTAGDGQVSLSWSAPANPNGRDISKYKIYYGKTEWEMTSVHEPGNKPYATVPGLSNGDKWYFAVTAFNTEGDESERTKPVNCTPEGIPGPPEGLGHENLWEGVRLTWREPRETGGATALTFTIRRWSASDALSMLAEVEGKWEFLDTNVTIGTTYSYNVTAKSTVGEGPACAAIEVRFLRVPSAVRDFRLDAGDSNVTLRWSAPASDGGSSVFVYIVFRNLFESPLNELARIPVGEFTGVYVDDDQVINNKMYYYCVRAQNSVGIGLPTDTLNATPLSPPGKVAKPEGRQVGSTVVLKWSTPQKAGSAPITGYTIYRGTKSGELSVLVELGPVLNYTDTTINVGTTYYYRVMANSAMGSGEQSSVEEVPTGPERVGSAYLMPLLLVIILVLVIAGVAVVYMRSQRKVSATEETQATEATAVGASVTPSIVAEVPPEAPAYIVEEVLVVYRDGRLIADCAREECKTEDADLMSGMLIAVQGIIQDGLERGGELESIKYGDKLVLMAGGSFMNLAVVVFGEPDEELKDALATTIQRIETSYAGIIEEWDGDLAVREGMEDLVRPLIDRTKDVTNESIARPEVSESVTLLSAVDFHRGYVRLKVAAVNGSGEAIIDAAIEVHYNRDMLRLERIEPGTLKLVGDRASLGNVKPGERATVAFLFDPQICQGTHIDGHLMYYDAKGGVHRVEMKRRTADVVCPIFFTKEHANTAMLRRLVKDKLKSTDMKLFRYPVEFSPDVVLSLGKAAIGDREVQLVREYVREGPPFYAEVWYYGETKVKGYQMVMRLGVVEEQRALEFFAASTTMEPVTGLLAEFRRELDEVMGREYSGGERMELDRDEGLRRALAERELMLDLIFAEEGGGEEGGGEVGGEASGRED